MIAAVALAWFFHPLANIGSPPLAPSPPPSTHTTITVAQVIKKKKTTTEFPANYILMDLEEDRGVTYKQTRIQRRENSPLSHEKVLFHFGEDKLH